MEYQLRKRSIGKEPTSTIGRLVPNNYQYPVGSIRKFSYKGINLKLDIHDYVSHFLYFGFNDPSHEKLMSLVSEGDIIFDVGTNYGATILQFAKIIGNNGKALGFEPDPVNFDICQHNLALNSFSNIEVDKIGLGSKEEVLILVVDTESNRGMNRIGKPLDGKESHEIKIKRVDDWILKKKIVKVNLIKIDVEGFEMDVLIGAENTLIEHRPILFIELDDNNLIQQGRSAKELICYLESLDYVMKHSELGNRVTSKNDFTNCHCDIICTRS